MPLLQMIINVPFLLAGFSIKTLFFMKKGMGKEYVSGLMNGVKLSCSSEGKMHKIPFVMNRIPNYMRIQWQLWINLFRIALKVEADE